MSRYIALSGICGVSDRTTYGVLGANEWRITTQGTRLDAPTRRRREMFYLRAAYGRKAEIENRLTGNGRKFSRRERHHRFDLYLAINQIDERECELLEANGSASTSIEQ